MGDARRRAAPAAASTRAASLRRASARCSAPRPRTQLDRAADGPQALALLLMAPEFQRR